MYYPVIHECLFECDQRNSKINLPCMVCATITGYQQSAPRRTTSHKPKSPSAAAYRHVAPPVTPGSYEQSPLPNDDEYNEEQRSVRDLKGVFTEKPEPPIQRREYFHHHNPPARGIRRPSLPPSWSLPSSWRKPTGHGDLLFNNFSLARCT